MAKDNINVNPTDEDYLDQLLNSVVNSDEEDDLLGDLDNKLNSVSDDDTVDIFQDIDGDADDFSSFNLDDILGDSLSENLDGIEESNVVVPQESESEEDGMKELMQGLENNFDDESKDISNVGENIDSAEGFAAYDKDDDFSDLLQNINGVDDIKGNVDIPGFDDNAKANDESENSEQSNPDEPAEEGESDDLDKMLNSMAGLSSDEEQQEFNPDQEEQQAGEQKEKKPGFFARLFKKKDKSAKDDAEQTEAKQDENEQLISEMESGEFDESELDELEDRTDKKKKKKEKKVKEKKEKKPKEKKEKKPKEKKEKPPVSKEDIIHIPIAAYFLMISFVAGVSLILVFGGSTHDYNSKMDAAVNAFVDKNYSKAYDKLAGLELKKKDTDFYDQVVTVMYVEQQYRTYSNYRQMGDYYKALNALINGIEKYDKYNNEAAQLGIESDMEYVYKKIVKKLKYDYNLSEKSARQIADITSKNEFSKKITSVTNKNISRIESNIEKENIKATKKTTAED